MSLRLAVAALLFLPSATLAQQAARGPVRVVSALSGVKLGTALRIASHGEPPRYPEYKRFRSTGKLLRVDSTAVWLELEPELAPTLWVPAPMIDTVWVQKRSTGRGIVIGGLVSAVVLSIFACQPTCAESGVIFPGLLITPIPGAVIGGVVGHNIMRWDRRLP